MVVIQLIDITLQVLQVCFIKDKIALPFEKALKELTLSLIMVGIVLIVVIIAS